MKHKYRKKTLGMIIFPLAEYGVAMEETTGYRNY